ncbi:hypothetical protein HDU91_001340 [Kappamyces sp. JEL0680]|nr:hypothetical protein HDU91_001340 [Kappamyces sp. JEL0680]
MKTLEKLCHDRPRTQRKSLISTLLLPQNDTVCGAVGRTLVLKAKDLETENDTLELILSEIQSATEANAGRILSMVNCRELERLGFQQRLGDLATMIRKSLNPHFYTPVARPASRPAAPIGLDNILSLQASVEADIRFLRSRIDAVQQALDLERDVEQELDRLLPAQVQDTVALRMALDKAEILYKQTPVPLREQLQPLAAPQQSEAALSHEMADLLSQFEALDRPIALPSKESVLVPVPPKHCSSKPRSPRKFAQAVVLSPTPPTATRKEYFAAKLPNRLPVPAVRREFARIQIARKEEKAI